MKDQFVRILLIKPSSFGDVIHALPMAHALRRHPGVESLDWVINTNLAGLLAGNPDVNRIIPFPRRSWTQLGHFLSELRQQQPYDWVIDLQGLFRSALIAWFARANKRIGMSDAREGAQHFYHSIAPISAIHAIDRYKQTLEFLGVSVKEMRFPLPPVPNRVSFSFSSPFVLIHPHSRWPTKILPYELLTELSAKLKPRLLVIAGQGRKYPIPDVIDLTNQTNFMELLYLLQQADAVISSDSGPMHLAAALGKPLVSLFGPTSPQKTGPWTTNSRTIQLSLPCIPCFSRLCKISDTQACLRRITSEMVINALREVEATTGQS